MLSISNRVPFYTSPVKSLICLIAPKDSKCPSVNYYCNLLLKFPVFFGRLSRSRSNFPKKLMSYVYGKSTFISNIRYL